MRAIVLVFEGLDRRVLLCEELGFDGVVCTDRGLVTASDVGGRTLPARARGVEHLDAAVRRLLRVKPELGLFDDPFVDESTAAERLGTAKAVAAGRRAQAELVTVLHRAPGTLPLAAGTRVHVEGVDPAAVEAAGLQLAHPEDAELAVVRLQAPWEPRDTYVLEAEFHAGSLEFDADTVARTAQLARRLPVVIAVHLDRPAVLTPLLPHSAALLAVYGTSDAALLDVLTGRVRPRGKLPFQLPRSDAAVAASRPDVPGDTADALFEAGAGVVADW
ncbi:glycoside hydrolase family 3 C-terminal domain-containing protein [Kineococcus arenarius]|uniref:glycoside hydrolase family 3 C-terminal domain-containing protein n=1 Tax=Kineococcus sp. SYSU DK007 TaxID=3383128 RepID=UPI003D7EC701